MTNHDFSRVPRTVTVRCAECRGPATFESATEWIGGSSGRALARDPAVVGVSFAKGFLRNRFPYLIARRTGPRGGFGHFDGAVGVVTCARCVSRREHTLSWPREAFYSIEHRGDRLWAWNREYLVMVRDFIASSDRRTAGHSFFRRKLPKPFLLAKNRAVLTRKLDALLAVT